MEVASLDALARKGRALSILAALGHEGAINMSQFTRSCSLVPDRAKVLREEMEAMGLLDVKVVRTQGAAEILEIRLSPLGKKVAAHVLEIERLLRGA